MRRLFVVLLLVTSSALAAQEAVETREKPDETAGQPKVTGAIVVTATRSERGVNELPVSTTVIGHEEIQSTPAPNADDLLRTIPGVHMPLATSSAALPFTQKFSMRGLGGGRALVLLDGLPLDDPFFGSVQWQKIPLRDLRQVEVVRGGNASLYGNFALGGTVNLLTRPVDSDLVRAEVSYGSHDTSRHSITVDHVLSERIGVRLSHYRHNTDGYIRVPNPGPVDVNGWTDSEVTTARVDYHPSDRNGGFFKAGWSEIDTSGGTSLTSSRRDLVDLSTGSHYATGQTGVVSLTAFHHRQAERAAYALVTAGRVSENFTTDIRTPSMATGGSLEWSTQRAGALSFLSMGIDLRQNEATDHRDSYRPGIVTQNHVHGTQQFAGVFAQTSWRPSDRLEVLTSARLDYYQSKDGFDELTGGATTRYPDKSWNQLNPRLSLRYAVGKSAALRGAVYRAFKAPTLQELYRLTNAGFTTVFGNPGLEPERLVGGDIGLDWVASRTRFELNLYYAEVDGYLTRTRVPGQAPNVVWVANLGRTRNQGLEAMADLQLTPRWSVNLGYTYADSVILEDPNPLTVGKLVPDVVPHIGTLTTRYRFERGTTAELRGRVLSRSYGEPTNVIAAPAHRVLDFYASHPLRSWISVYALLENAFDAEYFQIITINAYRSGQPRTFSAGVRFEMPLGRGNG